MLWRIWSILTSSIHVSAKRMINGSLVQIKSPSSFSVHWFSSPLQFHNKRFMILGVAGYQHPPMGKIRFHYPSWWCRNAHQWDARPLHSNNRCLKIGKCKKHLQKGGPVWSRPNTLRRLSQKTFLQLQSAREGLVTHIPFLRVLGPFYSSEVLPPFLAKQVSQTCWTSLSGLLDKPPLLVEQVSWNVMGKSGPSS